jgi:biotin-(acetyl-CoA carboxylase) ligase
MFLQAWDGRLAWRGEWVEIHTLIPGQTDEQGLVQGLNEDGSLRVIDRAGQIKSLYSAEISLRLLDVDAGPVLAE